MVSLSSNHSIDSNKQAFLLRVQVPGGFNHASTTHPHHRRGAVAAEPIAGRVAAGVCHKGDNQEAEYQEESHGEGDGAGVNSHTLWPSHAFTLPVISFGFSLFRFLFSLVPIWDT